MSIFRRDSKGRPLGVRCDWCGKFAKNPDGAYARLGGGAGYIVQPSWERFPGGDETSGGIQSSNDICEECAANRCPNCGSDQIVNLTPAYPGADGWGGRCKACGKTWGMPS